MVQSKAPAASTRMAPMAEFLTRRFACAHVDRGYGARYRWRRGPVSCSRFVRSRKYYTMCTLLQSVSQSVISRSRPRRQAAGAALRGRSSPPPLAIFFPALLSWGSSFLHFFPVPPRVMEPLASRNTLVVRWLPRHIYHRLCSPVTMCCRRRAPSVTPPSIAIL